MAEKTDRAVKWFMALDSQQQEIAVRALFDHAIESEWIDLWDEDDIEELAKESGRPIEEYRAPYYTTCGEPITEA